MRRRSPMNWSAYWRKHDRPKTSGRRRVHRDLVKIVGRHRSGRDRVTVVRGPRRLPRRPPGSGWILVRAYWRRG
jgi:hypothetical protein